jgi:hypothetical protein
MTPRDFVKRLGELASVVDDEGVIAFAEQHYASVAAQLTAAERRTVGSVVHAARMAVAMKQAAMPPLSGPAGAHEPSAEDHPVAVSL